MDKTEENNLDEVLKSLANLKTNLSQCQQYLEVPQVKIEMEPSILERWEEKKGEEGVEPAKIDVSAFIRGTFIAFISDGASG